MSDLFSYPVVLRDKPVTIENMCFAESVDSFPNPIVSRKVYKG